MQVARVSGDFADSMILFVDGIYVLLNSYWTGFRTVGIKQSMELELLDFEDNIEVVLENLETEDENEIIVDFEDVMDNIHFDVDKISELERVPSVLSPVGGDGGENLYEVIELDEFDEPPIQCLRRSPRKRTKIPSIDDLKCNTCFKVFKKKRFFEKHVVACIQKQKKKESEGKIYFTHLA